jgi:hypothetical protein
MSRFPSSTAGDEDAADISEDIILWRGERERGREARLIFISN